MQEWIDELEIGDKVVVSPQFHLKYIDKVKRITKTLIITANGSRFSKIWGSTPGNSWTPTSIAKFSTEKEQEINELKQKSMIIKKIQQISYSELSLKTLEKINTVIDRDK